VASAGERWIRDGCNKGLIASDCEIELETRCLEEGPPLSAYLLSMAAGLDSGDGLTSCTSSGGRLSCCAIPSH
jgi:hypothetical protein